jgi:putative peptidoglycan lipid II flippase
VKGGEAGETRPGGMRRGMTTPGMTGAGVIGVDETETLVLPVIRPDSPPMTPHSTTYVARPTDTVAPAYEATGTADTDTTDTAEVQARVGEPAAASRTASLLRSSSLMAMGTVVSRATGFLRTIIIAGALGTGIFADTYNAANTVPNMIYILLVGGALNSVFVPQLVRAMKNDEDGGEAYASRLLTLTAVVLFAIAMVAALAAPVVIWAAAHGFTKPGSADEYTLAVAFARYCLPQILFYGIYVMLGQVLNARGSFGPMMWTPILNNVVVITTFGLYLGIAGRHLDASTITPAETRLLGVGTTLGIVVQAATLVPYMYATGFRYRPRFDWRGVGLGKVGHLAKWTILFVLVNQLGYFVVTNVTTLAADHAKAAGLDVGVGYTPYSNAYLLFMLPHSIITVSVVTALLPRMSRAVTEARLAEVREDVTGTLRTIGVAIVPAAFGFLALGRDIAGVMYFSTGAKNAHVIGYVLMAFALGLIPFSAQYLLLRGFYAFEDTRTPVFIAVAINAVNVVLVLTSYTLLPLRWVIVGMAAGYGISYAVGLAITARVLGRRIGGLDAPLVVRTYARLVVAAAAAAAGAFVAARLCTAVAGSGLFGSAVAVLAGAAVMGGGYVLVAQRMRVAELDQLIAMVSGRLGRR